MVVRNWGGFSIIFWSITGATIATIIEEEQKIRLERRASRRELEVDENNRYACGYIKNQVRHRRAGKKKKKAPKAKMFGWSADKESSCLWIF